MANLYEYENGISFSYTCNFSEVKANKQKNLYILFVHTDLSLDFFLCNFSYSNVCMLDKDDTCLWNTNVFDYYWEHNS